MSGRQGRAGRRAAAAAVVAATAGIVLAAAGQLDFTFGTGGIVQTSLAGDPNWLRNDCAVLGGGRIVLGGSDEIGSTYRRWRLRAYNADGSTDTAFGSSGSVTLFGAGGGDSLEDLALDAAGRIVAVGDASQASVNPKNGKTTTLYGAGLARVLQSGALDPTFGGGGGTVITQVPNASSNIAKAVAVQPDGRIVVLGTAYFVVRRKGGSVIDPAMYLARYNEDGSLDGSFGSGGIVVTELAVGAETPVRGGVALQSDGRIVVGADVGSDIPSMGWTIVRFLPTGALDAGFPRISSPSDWLGGLSVDASDRIVAVGRRVYAGDTSDMLCVRYTPSGAPDASFGSGGVALVHSTPRSGVDGPVRLQADGKVVFSAIVFPNWPANWFDDGVAVRLNADGTPDATFGAGGVTAPIHIGDYSEPMTTDLAPDGRIVVGGRSLSGTATKAWFLARYEAN